MTRDNVTPFRPRRPQPKPPSPKRALTSHRGKAVLVQGLTIAAFALNFLWQLPPLSYLVMMVAIAAAVIAYSSRQEAMPWAATHHEHAFRTLLIGWSIITIIRLPTLFFPREAADDATYNTILLVGRAIFWGTVIVTVWAGVRALIGLVLALMRRPIWHPRGWLV
jgi:uncharacterized membrane protein